MRTQDFTTVFTTVLHTDSNARTPWVCSNTYTPMRTQDFTTVFTTVLHTDIPGRTHVFTTVFTTVLHTYLQQRTRPLWVKENTTRVVKTVVKCMHKHARTPHAYATD